MDNEELKQLERQLADIESEEPPQTHVSLQDVEELAEVLPEIIRTTKNPKKVRNFFGSFIESIFVEDDQVRIEYRPWYW